MREVSSQTKHHPRLTFEELFLAHPSVIKRKSINEFPNLAERGSKRHETTTNLLERVYVRYIKE